MFCIQLKGIRFRAFHGVYPEEKILGNDFIVTLKVFHGAPEQPIQHLEECLNYEKLFAVVKKHMDIPTPLLETITMNICGEILDTFEQVEFTTISIEKCNPPIPGLQGSVVVGLEQQRP